MTIRGEAVHDDRRIGADERGTRALDAYCQTTYRLPLDVVGKIQVMLAGPDVAAVDADAFAGQLAKVAELVSVLRRRLEGESL